MKKVILSSFILLSFFTIAYSQNGGGCTKAVTIQAGYHIVDTMIAGAATYAGIYPNPTKAKWYRFSPTSDGLLQISSCGGGSDTRLFLYEGSCDTLNLFGYNDDYCAKDGSGEETASDISKFVKAGKNYFIEWDNAWDSKTFGFSLSFSTNFVPTEMQACQSAKVLKTGTIKVDSIVGIASHGDAGHANWYKFTPTSNGKLSVSTCGLDADTRLWVYKGSCSALVPFAESDDECDGANFPDVAVALSNLSLVANTTYYFEWDDSWENVPFEFTFNFDGTSGVNDETLSKNISLAPNPASDYVDIQFNLDKMTDMNLRIFNSMGQAVLTQKLGSILRGSEKVDVTDLKSGIYILSFTDGIKQTNKKLVVNH
jgi:Secretion system C-terminal sorting domain